MVTSHSLQNNNFIYMKKNIALLAVLFAAVTIISCTKQNLSGVGRLAPKTKTTAGIIPPGLFNWFPIANFPGEASENCFSFSIGQIGYVGGGWGQEEQHFACRQTFFAYDPSTGIWSQRANVGGLSRESAATFVIGDQGFVTTGFHWYDGPPDPNQNERELKDTWEYIPVWNVWIQRADFPGAAREGAVGMAINGMGYVGTGAAPSPYANPYNYRDWWQFDPNANVWTRKSDFAGGPRTQATGCAAGSFGYLGTGFYNPPFGLGNMFFNDWWQYNPANDSWTQKSNLPGPVRRSAVSFGWNGTAYLGTGMLSNYYPTSDFWSYSPQTDNWTYRQGFPENVYNAAGFAVNGIGYIGTGSTDKTGPGTYQFWGVIL
jgi:N-acetylneuraminic acid mutarotase